MDCDLGEVAPRRVGAAGHGLAACCAAALVEPQQTGAHLKKRATKRRLRITRIPKGKGVVTIARPAAPKSPGTYPPLSTRPRKSIKERRKTSPVAPLIATVPSRSAFIAASA